MNGPQLTTSALARQNQWDAMRDIALLGSALVAMIGQTTGLDPVDVLRIKEAPLPRSTIVEGRSAATKFVPCSRRSHSVTRSRVLRLR